jgi:hypothetical protein
MKTAIEIVQEACRTVGQSAPTSFTDKTNNTVGKMLASLNRTAEDLSLDHNWLSQTRLLQFPLSKDSPAYDESVEGYDLNTLTSGKFARFTSAFLWDLTNKVKINGVPMDKFTQQQAFPALPDALSYVRFGKYIKFFPNDTTDIVVQCYYQTSYLAYKTALPNLITEYEAITEDGQLTFHDPRLLLRGILVNYAKNVGLDYSKFGEEYKHYRDIMIASESSASTIRFFAGYGETFLGRFPFIGG